MSATSARVSTFKVGRFVAEARLLDGAISIEWQPRVPRFQVDFTEAQRGEYRMKLMGAIVELRQPTPFSTSRTT